MPIISSMAFTPQYYSNYNNFSNGFCEFPAPVAAGDGGGLAMWCQENFPFFDNIGVAGNYMVPSESDISSSSVSTMSFPEAESHGAWNMTALPEFNIGFAAGNQQQEVCEFGEECSAFVSNVWPNYTPATNSWVSIFFTLSVSNQIKCHVYVCHTKFKTFWITYI